MAQLVAALEAVQDDDPDERSTTELAERIAALVTVGRRLEATVARLTSLVTTRRAERAIAEGDTPERARRRAERAVERELRGRVRQSPSRTKQARRLADSLPADSDAGLAFDRGELSPQHARALADTLANLVVSERVALEAELVAAAGELEAVAFGRLCRRRLAEVDAAAAERAAERRHARRTSAVWSTADGMLAFSGEVAGVDAEVLVTAVHAFRRPNAADETRTPQQATADAWVAMAQAALDAGTAPLRHGVRPHVTLTVDLHAVLRDVGGAEGLWTGPLTIGDVRGVLQDCGVGRLLVDPRGLPLEAGEQVRTVPAGLLRAIVARDGGQCAGDGCDVPVDWCQIMHLGTPYRFDGRLRLAEAAAGCRFHHDAYDRYGWQVSRVGGRPVIHHPTRPPAGADGPPSRAPTGRRHTPLAPSEPDTASVAATSAAFASAVDTSAGVSRDRSVAGGAAGAATGVREAGDTLTAGPGGLLDHPGAAALPSSSPSSGAAPPLQPTLDGLTDRPDRYTSPPPHARTTETGADRSGERSREPP